MQNLMLVLVILLAAILPGCEFPFQDMQSPKQVEIDNPSPTQQDKTEKKCPLRFEKFEVCIALTWIQPPTLVGETTATVSLTKNGAVYTVEPGLEFYTKIFMPEHEHGSAPIKLTPIPEGLSLSQIYFTMPGLWLFKFRIRTQENKRTLDEAIVPLNL